ncbi:MAG: hypothetical protein ACRDTG_16680 [Pseudonocardiaceae bacterium]
MIREDRELLAELARLNSDVVPLAMRIIEGSATTQEQRVFAQRLVTAGQRLHRRTDECERMVLDGVTIFTAAHSLPLDTGTNAVRHLRS